MSIGSWTPATATTIDRKFLEKAISLARHNQLEAMADHFDAGEIERYAPAMRMTQAEWASPLADFSSDELRLLIQFFTRAEMLLTGWEAGDTSPAIWANKQLKERGERLGAEELRWLRDHSSNRFIPNGRL